MQKAMVYSQHILPSYLVIS